MSADINLITVTVSGAFGGNKAESKREVRRQIQSQLSPYATLDLKTIPPGIDFESVHKRTTLVSVDISIRRGNPFNQGGWMGFVDIDNLVKTLLDGISAIQQPPKEEHLGYDKNDRVKVILWDDKQVVALKTEVSFDPSLTDQIGGWVAVEMKIKVNSSSMEQCFGNYGIPEPVESES